MKGSWPDGFTEYLHFFRDFYESDKFTKIREKIDKKESIRKLEERFPADLANYLNFFEFLLFLKNERAITEKHLNIVFNYYLNKLAEKEDGLDYFKEFHYENLAKYVESNQRESSGHADSSGY